MTRAFTSNLDGGNAYIQNVVCDYPAAPNVGDLVRVGDMIGYALEDEDALGYTLVDFGPREIEGTVTCNSDAITVGEKIYFRDNASPLINDSSGNKFAGYALEVITDSSGNASIAVLKTAPGGT